MGQRGYMPPRGRPRNPPWCPCIRGDMRTARALWRMPFTIRTSRLTEKGWGSTFWPQASCLYSYIRYVYIRSAYDLHKAARWELEVIRDRLGRFHSRCGLAES